ncbi:MAG: ROK family protein [Clostridia bacterium]|nr:ROK family protein [Clostridia bacterium]
MYYIGIDLGGTNIAAGIVDENMRIVRKGSVPTGAFRDPDEITADMAELCKKLLADEGLSLDDLKAVGIGAPGSIDPVRKKIIWANTMSTTNYPLGEKLAGMLGYPVKKIFMDNDANAAALGETVAGAAKGAKHAIMITLGTGVGGGIVIDGKIYAGFNNMGAEIGHMVIKRGGRKCNCGRRGCFEAYCSATALRELTAEAMKKDPDSVLWQIAGGDITKVSAKDAFEAKRRGDRTGTVVADRYIKDLACGVANLVNIFQPEVLCIGGGVCNEGAYLLDPVVRIVKREQFTHVNKIKTKVVIAALGNDAGIIGAAALGV